MRRNHLSRHISEKPSWAYERDGFHHPGFGSEPLLNRFGLMVVHVLRTMGMRDRCLSRSSHRAGAALVATHSLFERFFPGSHGDSFQPHLDLAPLGAFRPFVQHELS